MKRRHCRSTTSYYRTLYGKYGIDDACLMNRAQRRATGSFLEQVDNRNIRPLDRLTRRHYRRFLKAFRGSSLASVITASLTAGALMGMLQSPPVFAHTLSSNRPAVTEKFSSYAMVITDEDGTDHIMQNSAHSAAASIHLATRQAPYTPVDIHRPDALLIDDDSDIPSRVDQGRSLVVIDTGIEDWQSIRDAVTDGEILLLERIKDPLSAIIDKLQDMGTVDSLSIFSHGSSGALYLGDTKISAPELKHRSAEWHLVGSHLSQEGDILLYGCNVGQGEPGITFLDELASLTGADVAASINASGNTAKRADWTLEVVRGEIDPLQGLSLDYLKQFPGMLAWSGTIDFCTVYYSGAWGGSATIDAQIGGAGGYTLTIDGQAHSTYAGGCLAYSMAAENQVTLTFNGNASFDAGSIFLYNFGSPSETFIVSSDKGDSLTTASIPNFSGSNVNLSGFSSGITRLYIAPLDGSMDYMAVSNLVVANVTSATDSDGNLMASPTVTEPVGLETTVTSPAAAVNVFDFTISDGGTSDGLPLTVSQAVIHVSGTSTDTERSQVTWRLNGPDATNVTGTFSAGAITFSGLSISVADGGSETYTLNAYYNNSTNLTEDHTFILSIDGDTDLTVGSGGTRMGTTTAVTNGTGSTIDVTATALQFSTQPAGSTSGFALISQPVVRAVDAFGNTDVDFTETVTLTEASPGTLANNTRSASSGIAAFTNVTYTATADQQPFTLTANDQDGVGTDLPAVDANPVISDVVATKLQFTTEPAPTSMYSGLATAMTTAPVVSAVDANNLTDTGYSSDITLSEANGTGSAIMSGTGDTDGSAATVTLTPSSGTATFTGLSITYTASGATNENFNLHAASGGLATADSTLMTAIVDTTPPTVTDANISISGATGIGGAYKVGDTVTAAWDNTASGDNNTDVNTVTIDFSQFGGSAAVSASNSSDTWTATYTITEGGGGGIEATNRNISVTATDIVNNSATTADTTNATVDNVTPAAPSVPALAPGSDTGFSSTDNITKIATPDFIGSAEAQSTVVVTSSLDGTAGSTVAGGLGAWTITSALLSEGMHSMTATATDTAGNMSGASGPLLLTIDTTDPILSGVPGDIIVDPDPGQNTAVVNWTAPTANDNLDGVLTPVQTEGLPSGSDFPVGLTTITYTATDTAGNTSSASFTVTVNQLKGFSWPLFLPGIISPKNPGTAFGGQQ